MGNTIVMFATSYFSNLSKKDKVNNGFSVVEINKYEKNEKEFFWFETYEDMLKYFPKRSLEYDSDTDMYIYYYYYLDTEDGCQIPDNYDDIPDVINIELSSKEDRYMEHKNIDTEENEIPIPEGW